MGRRIWLVEYGSKRDGNSYHRLEIYRCQIQLIQSSICSLPSRAHPSIHISPRRHSTNISTHQHPKSRTTKEPQNTSQPSNPHNRDSHPANSPAPSPSETLPTPSTPMPKKSRQPHLQYRQAFASLASKRNTAPKAGLRGAKAEHGSGEGPSTTRAPAWPSY